MAEEVVAEKPRPIDTGVKQADIAASIEAKKEADKTKVQPSAPAKVEAEPAKPKPLDVRDDGERAGDEGEQQPDANGDLPDGVTKKLGKLTRRVYEAREEAERAKAEKDREKARADELQRYIDQLQQAKPGVQAPQTPSAPEPKSDDRPTLEAFGMDPEKYLEALAEWKYDQKQKADAEQRANKEKLEATQKKLGTHKEREQAFAAANPDYFEKAYQAPVNYSREMLEYVTESEHGPAIAYYLADHLDEAKAIEALPPMRQAIALDRLEQALKPAEPDQAATQRPAKTVTKAPPPPATVSAAGTPRKSANDPGLSTQERIAMWRRNRGR